MITAQKLNPFSIHQDYLAYLVDAGQRSVLYWDVMRRRGNHFWEYMAKETPHVLQFDYQLILDGRTLPQPRIARAKKLIHERSDYDNL